MTTVPLGHTCFSWRGSATENYVPLGHTKFSWVDSGSNFDDSLQSGKSATGASDRGDLRKCKLYAGYPMLNRNIDFTVKETAIDQEMVLTDTGLNEATTQFTAGKKDLDKTTVVAGVSEQKRAATTKKMVGEGENKDFENTIKIQDQDLIERKLKELSCKSDNGIGVAHLIVEGEKKPIVHPDPSKTVSNNVPAESTRSSAAATQSRPSAGNIDEESEREPAPPKSGGCCTIA